MPPRKRRPVTQSGNLNRSSTDFPRPASNPSPRPNAAAAVLGNDPVSLTGEEKMRSFGDVHNVPVSEMMRDPVFPFAQPTIRGAGELSIEGAGGRLFGQTNQIPTNYQMQRLGTGTVVSLKGGSIRTAEWEQGNKLRRAWVRAEEYLDKDPSNEQYQEAVARARTAIDKSPLFDAEGGVGDFGKPFYAYQRQANGESLVQTGQQAPPLTGDQITFRGRGSQKIGDTDFQRTTITSPGERGTEEWTARDKAIKDARARGEEPPAGRVPTPITQVDGVWTGRGAPRGARPTADPRERGDLIGAPPGDKPVTQGQLSVMKNRLSVAKTADQKAALIKKWEAAAKRKGFDLTTAKPYMKLKEAEYKRGEKKRVSQQTQQLITDILDPKRMPKDRGDDFLKRLNETIDPKELLKNRSYRRLAALEGYNTDKKKGKPTKPGKPLTPKALTELGFNASSLILGDNDTPGMVKKEELIAAFTGEPSIDDGGLFGWSFEVPPGNPTEMVDQIGQFVGMLYPTISDADRQAVTQSIFAEALATSPEALAAFSKLWQSRQQGQAPDAGAAPQAPDTAARENFINEGGAPPAQAPQRPNMGTSPVVGPVPRTPPGKPEFSEDLSFYTAKPDGSFELYDEQKNVKMTIGKDGRRYWTYVVFQGGKQVSETVELEGGGPTPQSMQEAAAATEAGGGAAAKPAAKAAPAAGDKKQLQADIDQALSGGL